VNHYLDCRNTNEQIIPQGKAEVQREEARDPYQQENFLLNNQDDIFFAL
jgi:hypothetical protein